MSAKQSGLVWGILLGLLLMYLYRRYQLGQGRG